MGRRNKKRLKEVIVQAKGKKERAFAYYQLGLFHDNNAREAEAIPNYMKALELGLDRETKAKALAWLASSLYKTNEPKKGLARCHESQKITKDKKLKEFLDRIEKGIKKSLRI